MFFFFVWLTPSGSLALNCIDEKNCIYTTVGFRVSVMSCSFLPAVGNFPLGKLEPVIKNNEVNGEME